MKITFKRLKQLIREALKKVPAIVPDALYHATSEKNVSSILARGIVPNNNPSWNMPEAAVFLIDSLENAMDMYDTIGHHGRVEVFIVHVDKLSPQTKFYKDLDAGEGAFWTPEVIPPEALEQVIFDD